MRATQLAAVLAAGFVLAVPASARGQFRGWGAAGTLSYDARYSRYDADPDAIGDLEDAADLGVTLRGIAGNRSPAGFAAGFDFHLGAGLSGGFAYDVALSPLGAGVMLGKWGLVGAVVGVGVSGVTDRVPFGVQVPLEAFADFGLSRYFRVHAWGTRRYLAVADDRPHERSAGILLRFNRNYDKWGFASGNGYYVGVTYDERMRTEAIGVMVGYSIHFATAR